MSIQPIITFKAGVCDLNSHHKVKPKDTPGYVYLYEEDGMLHFCWRPRYQPPSQPEIDLLMIPGDASFMPYIGEDDDAENVRSPTSGRICVLKFSSSSQRYLFWLQSKSDHPSGDPSCFSERDLKIQNIVDMLLAGEEIDVQAELASLQNISRGPRRDEDDDETMEDVEGTDHAHDRPHGGGAGGAGPDATGGDYREEGEEAREGGADGARAAAAGTTDAQQAVQNFLNSLRGGGLGGQQPSGDEFATLMDLLSPDTTVPVIDRAPASLIDSLCANLPPMILLLAQEIDDLAEVDPNSETAQAAIEALDQDSKKDVLKRVLNSPQMSQSLASLTVALRDGGLPNVSQALKIDVANGGYLRGGAMPIGGGDAVKVFLEGVKKTVQKEGEGEEMDTT